MLDVASTLTMTQRTNQGTLKVEVKRPDEGYTEWDITLGTFRWSGANTYNEATTVAAALSHVLSDLAEDCDHDMTWFDHNDNSALLLENKDLARTLVEQGYGDVPQTMFVRYARDVVPSA